MVLARSPLVRPIAGLLAALFSLLSVRAEAAPSAGEAHFLAGKTAYQQGKFAEAARQFKAAYEIDHLPDLIYDVGRSCHNLYLLSPDDAILREAIAAYRRYLTEFPEGRYRKEAMQSLNELTLIAAHQVPPPPIKDDDPYELVPDKAPDKAPPVPAPAPVVLPPLPPPIAAPLPPWRPYVVDKPSPKRAWVTPVAVVSSIAVTALALGLGLGLGLHSGGSDGGTLGKWSYPW
jgi:tetratricopeptide (TPR) repeat protein